MAGDTRPSLAPGCVPFETLEGPEPEGLVVLEFPTIADAKAWYESPAYQDALVHRKAGSISRAFLVEGV